MLNLEISQIIDVICVSYVFALILAATILYCIRLDYHVKKDKIQQENYKKLELIEDEDDFNSFS